MSRLSHRPPVPFHRTLYMIVLFAPVLERSSMRRVGCLYTSNWCANLHVLFVRRERRSGLHSDTQSVMSIQLDKDHRLPNLIAKSTISSMRQTSQPPSKSPPPIARVHPVWGSKRSNACPADSSRPSRPHPTIQRSFGIVENTSRKFSTLPICHTSRTWPRPHPLSPCLSPPLLRSHQ